MPLVSLFAFAPLVVCPGHARPGPLRPQTESTREPLQAPREVRGKVRWYEGSFEQALAEAARTEQLVFLDFFSRSNTYSKKLEKVTYCDPKVVAELSRWVCVAVDADSKDSKALRKRFQVLSAPALVFLDKDGSLRDQLSGYLGPEPFLMEVCRIRANQGTFSDLRARIQRDGNDLDSRWKLACKLRAIGDLVGYEEQVAELRERDREGRSPASRRMRLSNLATAAAKTLDLEPLYGFVEGEQDPSILCEAWRALWELEEQALRSVREPAAKRMHELRYFAAARALWPLVPVEQHGFLGNNIAWRIYENRAVASHADLEFALCVATKAVEAARDVAYVVDTLACCLFALGRRAEALTQVKRCIELDPQNPVWRERLAEFEKGP